MAREELTPLRQLAQLARLEGRFRALRSPGPWLVAALVLGAAARVFLAVFTEGTDDVPIWESHAGWVHKQGLVRYYAWQEVMNHPPFIGRVHAALWELAREWGIPFRAALRLPYAAIDFGSALLLARVWRDSPFRYALLAGYWLNPLAILFSAYHGNTDTAVAFFMLLAVLLAGRGRPALAGAALGVGCWVKLPATLAAFALFFFQDSWRRRLVFAGVFAAVGAIAFVPVGLEAWDLLYARVLAYPGLHITTPDGQPIWGVWNVLGGADALPAPLHELALRLAALHERHNRLVALAPIALLSWLRRGETDARGLGTTVCGCLLLFHGLTNFWAWQYLAWLLPFLYFPGPRFALASTAVIGSFVYFTYASFCGSPLLLGRWDFNAFRTWPVSFVALRDASLLFCLGSGLAFLGAAARREWRRARAAEAAP